MSNRRHKEKRTTVLGGEAVDRVISLGLGTNVAREGVGGEGAVVAAVLVNTSDVDLDGSVVLGANEAVSGGANWWLIEKEEGFKYMRQLKVVW